MEKRTRVIFGAGGFLGRHLIASAEPEGLLAPRSKEVDLLDPKATTEYIREHRPEWVIHAAGFVGGIGLNKAHPGRMASDNLRMGMNLLEACKDTDTHLVIVSTVCAYEVDAPIPTPETALMGGNPAADTLPYGYAKRMLYVAAEAMHREFGLNFTYIVPTNLYGPEDHFEEEKSHVVPALLKRAHEAQQAGTDELVVWGDGTATRDLLYVEDAAKALLTVAQSAPSNDVFNISSGRETSIRELAETVCSTVGFSGRLVFDPTKPGGAPRRALDGSKAKAHYGIEPKTSLEKGLKETYRWYVGQLTNPAGMA